MYRNSSPAGVKRALFLAFICATVLLPALPARAIIDISLQMQLGNPSGATMDPNNTNHYLVLRTVEALDFSDALGEPVWASWDLTTADVGSAQRQNDYRPDPSLPTNFYAVTDTDYNGVGNIDFNRGHMCPSEDRTDTTNDNSLLFLMDNIIPQAATNNQGVWGSFEDYCRTQANNGNELLIVCGPSVFTTNRIPSGKAAIPNYTWKIAVVVPLGSGSALSRITAATRVISVKIPNSNNVVSTWQTYVTNAGTIENDTGFSFFTALPPNIATVFRNVIDGQTPPAPTIAGFSPSSAAANASVNIAGTNLVFVTNVTFNGVSAAFTINSSNSITATVPATASTGLIKIWGLGGNVTSSTSFVVSGVTAPDLAISLSHPGNFIQGDVGDTYTIIVTNVGTAASSGSVTVTDTLPAGLTALAISGAGWTTNLATLTATRSDAVAAGFAYPPITITVSVASNAPSAVTNTVTVSGGGDSNSANNTANDPTTINAVGVPDLAVIASHVVNFTQGDIGDTYTIIVTNVGGGISSGSLSITDALPTGLTATAISGTGWTTNLGALTATRSDGLAAGSAYPAITVTVNVATNAPASVTNAVTVSGGGESNTANDTANDVTAVNSFSSGGGTTNSGVIVGWDTSGIPVNTNIFGVSPFSPTTNAPNLTITPLTRGSGVGTNGTGAGRGWGGEGFSSADVPTAVSANQFFTFGLTANAGYQVTVSSISQFSYRRSGTGPPSGELQYQIGAGAFSNAAALSYSSTSSTGASLGSIDLSGISALQNVGAGTNITFRIVNYGGGSSGTWYIFDTSNSPAADLAVQGVVAPVNALTPIQSWRLQYFRHHRQQRNRCGRRDCQRRWHSQFAQVCVGLESAGADQQSGRWRHLHRFPSPDLTQKSERDRHYVPRPGHRFRHRRLDDQRHDYRSKHFHAASGPRQHAGRQRYRPLYPFASKRSLRTTLPGFQ